ncbi:hypothetical protein ACHAXN_009647 [Cyclotella atomus]
MKSYGAVSITADEGDGNASSTSANSFSGVTSRDSRWGAIVGIASLLLVIASSLRGRINSTFDPELQDMPVLSLALGPYDDGHDMNEALFYDEQLVNHFSEDLDAAAETWSNRYYKSTKYFQGPGSPIFLIVGGEGALDTGMLYPFVTEHLAPRFGAAVIEIEHRFYGPYRPIMGREATVEELLELLTPQQAMADMVQLTKHFKDELDCLNYDRTSEKYCPVISVGGSYPGFLSAMFRLAYPDFVDISYASSAPLKLYDQSADQYSYYDIVTAAAERISPGCATAVRNTLDDASEAILASSSMDEALDSLNVCAALPDFINDLASLNENVMVSVTYSFAGYDMDDYPPSKDLMLYKACQVFQKGEEEGTDSLETLKKFFKFSDGGDCFDLSEEMEGSNNDDKMWDFQVCTWLVNPIGQSESSMFYPLDWTLNKFEDTCISTYGVSPKPGALATDLGFRDLADSGASRILFTNGMQDMWAGGSYLENVTDSIIALNFENGAHHSDLSHVGPTDKDTDDTKAGFVKITNILAGWLDEIRTEAKH